MNQFINRENIIIYTCAHINDQMIYSHTCKASGCGLCIYIRGVKDAFNGNLTSTTGLSLYGLLTLIPLTYKIKKRHLYRFVECVYKCV